MKRSPLRTDPEKRLAWLRAPRKPLAVVSPRKTREKPQRDAVRAAVLERDGYRCRLASGHTPSLHGGGPTYHHLLKEGQGGAYTEENGICLCAWCNAWVEAEPNAAWRLGLVQRAGETVEETWRRLWVHGLTSAPYPGSRP